MVMFLLSSPWSLLPIHHAGAVKLLHFPFSCGASVVIQTRFEPVQFCANIERYRISMALIVPPVLVVLARHPGKAFRYKAVMKLAHNFLYRDSCRPIRYVISRDVVFRSCTFGGCPRETGAIHITSTVHPKTESKIQIGYRTTTQ